MRPMLSVESDIPIPPPGRGRRGKGVPQVRFPWRALQIGESFFVPLAGRSVPSVRNIINASRRQVKGVDFAVFTTRAVEGGVRVWRIE